MRKTSGLILSLLAAGVFAISGCASTDIARNKQPPITPSCNVQRYILTDKGRSLFLKCYSCQGEVPLCEVYNQYGQLVAFWRGDNSNEFPGGGKLFLVSPSMQREEF